MDSNNEAVEYKGETIAAGSYVMLRNPDADGDPFVAQVTKIIEYVGSMWWCDSVTEYAWPGSISLHNIFVVAG